MAFVAVSSPHSSSLGGRTHRGSSSRYTMSGRRSAGLNAARACWHARGPTWQEDAV